MSSVGTYETLEQRVGLAVELLADAGYDGTQSMPLHGPYYEFFVEEMLREGVMNGQARRALTTASYAITNMLLEAERLKEQTPGEIRE